MQSLAETDSAHACKVADRVDHPNRKYRRTRKQAAEALSETLGVKLSEEWLRKQSCSYVHLAGRVLYADDDLIELATRLLADAQKRGTTLPALDPAEKPRGGLPMTSRLRNDSEYAERPARRGGRLPSTP